jgi:hypothetical protein
MAQTPGSPGGRRAGRPALPFRPPSRPAVAASGAAVLRCDMQLARLEYQRRRLGHPGRPEARRVLGPEPSDARLGWLSHSPLGRCEGRFQVGSYLRHHLLGTADPRLPAAFAAGVALAASGSGRGPHGDLVPGDLLVDGDGHGSPQIGGVMAEPIHVGASRQIAIRVWGGVPRGGLGHARHVHVSMPRPPACWPGHTQPPGARDRRTRRRRQAQP